MTTSLTEHKKKEESSDLVVQHNNLIGAKRNLTLQEYRVILWLISKVRVDDEDFKEHELNVVEFCNIIGIRYDCMYQRLAKITKSLMEKVIEIKTVNGSKEILEQVGILSYARYESGQGKVVLSFHPRMGRFLLDLQNNFTKTSLSISLKFSSLYSLRFYELMRQNIFSRVSFLTISELRTFFGVRNEQYSNYKDFKKYVIKPSINEVNEKSDLDIEWSEIKKGRKVELIRFLIKEAKDVDQKKLSYTDEFLEKEYSISQYSLDKLRKEFSEKAIQQGLDVLIKHKGKLRNPLLFLRSAIQEGWQPFVEEKKKEISENEKKISFLSEIDSLNEDLKSLSFRKNILEKIGEAEYKSWFKDASFSIEESNVFIDVGSSFVKDWIDTHICRLLSDCFDGYSISCRVREKMVVIHEEKQGGPLKSTVSRKKKIDKKVKREKEKNERKVEQPKKSFWQRITSFWKSEKK